MRVAVFVMAMLLLSPALLGNSTRGNSTLEAFQWLRNLVDGVMDNGFNLLKHLLTRAFYMLLVLARILYMVVGLTGFISWFTGYSPYKGRRMVIGSLLLALTVEAISHLNIHP